MLSNDDSDFFYSDQKEENLGDWKRILNWLRRISSGFKMDLGKFRMNLGDWTFEGNNFGVIFIL